LCMQMLEHLRAKNYWLHKQYGPLASNAYHICLIAIGMTNPSPDTRFSMLSQLVDIINYEKDISLSWDARSKKVREFHELLGKVSIEQLIKNRTPKSIPNSKLPIHELTLLEQSNSFPKRGAELTMGMYLDTFRMCMFFISGQSRIALSIADRVVTTLSMADSKYYSVGMVTIVMDCILSIHIAERCKEAIEHDFSLLDKISEYYPIGQIIKQKYMDKIKELQEEKMENRVEELSETLPETEPLFHEEIMTKTLPLDNDDFISIFSSNSTETNLPWNEAM